MISATVTINKRLTKKKIAYFADEKTAILTNIKRAIEKTVDGAKNELVETVKSRGLGSRLANTWKRRVYPEVMSISGRAESLSYTPKGVVYTVANEIMMTQSEGATIRPSTKRFLAVPTKDVQMKQRGTSAGTQTRAGVSGPNAGRFAKGITPKIWAEKNGTTLRTVWLKNKGKIKGLLISNADNEVKFLLLSQVTLSKHKFNVKNIFKSWAAKFPQIVRSAIKQ